MARTSYRMNSRKANLTDHDTFSQIVSMAADDADIDINTPEYRKALKVATVFEKEVEKGLNLWVPKHLDVFDPSIRGIGDFSGRDVVTTLMHARNNEAPFMYFMELEGHGVGTWDGSWGKYFTDDRAIKELSNFMKKHLSRIYGQLQNAIYEAADASRLDRDGEDDDDFGGGRFASRSRKAALAKVGGYLDGSVKNWLDVMSALIIQNDRAQQERSAKRGFYHNPYGLVLTMEALDKVRSDVKKYMNREDEEALSALEKSVLSRFTESPYRNKFFKSLDKFRADGKAPKYPMPPGGGGRMASRGSSRKAAGFTADKEVLAMIKSGNVAGENFAGANLFGANLSFKNLSGANFRNASFVKANLMHAEFHGADLRGADFSFANLMGTDLSEAKLHRAKFSGIDYNYDTKFPPGFKLPGVSVKMEYDEDLHKGRFASQGGRKAALAEDTTAPVIGDILVSYSGYDNNKVDFHEVVGVSSSMITIRQIDKKVVREDNMGNQTVMPVAGRYLGAPMKKRSSPLLKGYMVKINSLTSAYLWTGKPESERPTRWDF